MSIKTVNALSHYTDWTIGHVHSGALGWVAMISIGTMYALIPRSSGASRCTARADRRALLDDDIGVGALHHVDGIAGVMQGLMWRATKADGTLTYAFIESISRTLPVLRVRRSRRAGPRRHVSSWPTTSGRRSPGAAARPMPPVIQPA